MKKIFIQVVLSGIALLTFAQIGHSQNKADKIAELLSLYYRYDQFNGSALVAEAGEIVHRAGHGWANMEWDINNTADTKHRLGSITKQFTAMLVLQLAEEGKVDLHTPISKYIPNYPAAVANKVTLHHLLTHSSGIPNYTSFGGFFKEQSRDPYTPEEFLSMFQDSTLNFEPGSNFDYSNSGYFLLGYIIETVTGNSYEDELEERIFEPLGMDNTGFDHHEDILKKRATGYERQGAGYINAPYLDMSIPYSAGSMYSTVDDLFLWDKALYTDQLLTKESKDMMFENHMESLGSGYGYGWSVDEVDGEKIVGHGGGINGFNTVITRFLGSKDVIILLNNTGGANLGEISERIKAILEDKPYELPKQSVAMEVYQTMDQHGVDKGIEKFNQIKGDPSYQLNEREMNQMGYQFLSSDQVDEALAIFKLNVETYPQSSNVYDSYGEALAESGDKEAAISNYKKSVELNPGNEGGIEMLKKLGAEVDNLLKDVVVDDAILQSYVGKYEIQPGFVIEITKDGTQLSGKATGQPSVEIYPKSETEFFLKVVEAQIIFNKGADGKISGLTLVQGGQEMPGKKIE